jgi:uncharacterized protein (DUF2147 family)
LSTGGEGFLADAERGPAWARGLGSQDDAGFVTAIAIVSQRRLAYGTPARHALGMSAVDQPAADAIRSALHKNGDPSAVVAVRRRFPALTSKAKAFLLCRFVSVCLLATALLSLGIPRPAVAAGIPEGVWLIEPTTASLGASIALQIFDCSGVLCGRVAWLRNVRDPTGQIQRDKFNPDPALRQRLLCGLTVFWGLRPVGEGKWTDGWFYDPDGGKTYRVSAVLRSSDTFVARIYLGIPFFGETRILRRVPQLRSEGWCD